MAALVVSRGTPMRRRQALFHLIQSDRIFGGVSTEARFETLRRVRDHAGEGAVGLPMRIDDQPPSVVPFEFARRVGAKSLGPYSRRVRVSLGARAHRRSGCGDANRAIVFDHSKTGDAAGVFFHLNYAAQGVGVTGLRNGGGGEGDERRAEQQQPRRGSEWRHRSASLPTGCGESGAAMLINRNLLHFPAGIGTEAAQKPMSNRPLRAAMSGFRISRLSNVGEDEDSAKRHRQAVASFTRVAGTLTG